MKGENGGFELMDNSAYLIPYSDPATSYEVTEFNCKRNKATLAKIRLSMLILGFVSMIHSLAVGLS